MLYLCKRIVFDFTYGHYYHNILSYKSMIFISIGCAFPAGSAAITTKNGISENESTVV
ncbi:hypothetical protein PIROE2DRAFT_4740 [Piromyces sp. E2]|nr:hypothetical protein PIROE2DRAFT_4740 [Piromyces sp. E2]|eukprot:OUM67784.1 hypothetical protein PIROE2DRAFT_4740 [Piromyces sp. E2]